jgi:hypothetical protein
MDFSIRLSGLNFERSPPGGTAWLDRIGLSMIEQFTVTVTASSKGAAQFSTRQYIDLPSSGGGGPQDVPDDSMIPLLLLRRSNDCPGNKDGKHPAVVPVFGVAACLNRVAEFLGKAFNSKGESTRSHLLKRRRQLHWATGRSTTFT